MEESVGAMLNCSGCSHRISRRFWAKYVSTLDNPTVLAELLVQSCFNYSESMSSNRRFRRTNPPAPEYPTVLRMNTSMQCNDASKSWCGRKGANSYVAEMEGLDDPTPN